MITIYPIATNVKVQSTYLSVLIGCLTKKQMQNPIKNNISSISIGVKSLRVAQFLGWGSFKPIRGMPCIGVVILVHPVTSTVIHPFPLIRVKVD